MTEPHPSRAPHPDPQHETRGQRLARSLLGMGLFLLGLWTLRGFLPALAWAAVFAIAIWPPFRRVQRRFPPGRRNLLLPLLFTLAVALVFIVPLALVAVQLSQEVHGALRWLMDVQRNGIPRPAWLARLPLGVTQATSWWDRTLARPGGTSQVMGRLMRTDVVMFSRNVGSQLLHRVVLFGFTLLTLFFLFRDGDAVSAQMVRASRRVFGPRGEHIGGQIIASVHGTVSGLVLVGLGQGVILGIAYALAGVPHPTLFGTLTAAAAMIPFGAPAAYGIASLLLLGMGHPGAAIFVFALGSIVLFVADHFVRPALIGGATRLPFLWVLLGILGGVEVWGLLGLFIGPAIMAALIMLWRELAEDPAPCIPHRRHEMPGMVEPR